MQSLQFVIQLSVYIDHTDVDCCNGCCCRGEYRRKKKRNRKKFLVQSSIVILVVLAKLNRAVLVLTRESYDVRGSRDMRDSYNIICDDKRDRIQTSGGACKCANCCVQFNSPGSVGDYNHCCRHSWVICILEAQFL